MTEEPFAVRQLRRYFDAIARHDFDALADSMTDDYCFEDRRLGLRSVANKAEQLDQLRVLADLGLLPNAAVDEIDTRGEQLLLYRLTFTSATDLSIGMLIVRHLNEAGRAVRDVLFDEGDMDAARAELDAIAEREQA